MKNFLSKYWKRILIIIGVVLVAINIWGKCVAPRLLISEYAKYGPNVERSESGVSTSINTSDVINNINESSPFNEDMTKIVLILMAGILLVAVVSDMTSKKSSGAKKK